MQISSANGQEYIKVILNTQCGITVYINVGFELREVTTDFNIRLCTDQHHTVIVWRSKEGRAINIKVDDYKVKHTDFSALLNEVSDCLALRVICVQRALAWSSGRCQSLVDARDGALRHSANAVDSVPCIL